MIKFIHCILATASGKLVSADLSTMSTGSFYRYRILVSVSSCQYRVNGHFHSFRFKDIINLYFTKFAVICLSPSIFIQHCISPSNQHINGCFILTENWYALPMVFFLLLGTQNKMTRYHILKYLGPKACQSTCSYGQVLKKCDHSVFLSPCS